jgi:hypothetical protein
VVSFYFINFIADKSNFNPKTDPMSYPRIILLNLIVFLSLANPLPFGGAMNSIELFSSNHRWKSLFNGETLDGWSVKCLERDRDHAFWSVENGTLLANSMGNTGHDYIWLQSMEEYSDFELRLKFQPFRESPGNAGVQIRSRYDDAEGWLNGPQVDINPPGPWRTGLIYDETRGHQRWISPSLDNWMIDSATYAPPKVVQFYPDEGPGWNDLTIICRGTRIKTMINNIVISDYDGSGVLDDQAHKKYNVGLKGHIALQIHRNDQVRIRFKDIEIREL